MGEVLYKSSVLNATENLMYECDYYLIRVKLETRGLPDPLDLLDKE